MFAQHASSGGGSSKKHDLSFADGDLLSIGVGVGRAQASRAFLRSPRRIGAATKQREGKMNMKNHFKFARALGST